LTIFVSRCAKGIRASAGARRFYCLAVAKNRGCLGLSFASGGNRKKSTFRVVYVVHARLSSVFPSILHELFLFPTDPRSSSSGFRGLDKLGKTAMPFFSKNTRPFGPNYCRPEFRTPEKSAPSRCGILPHSKYERQDAAATSSEVNDSISRVFAVLPEVSIRQRLTVFGRTFFVPQISKVSLFFVHRAPRTPRWLVASRCGILPHSREERLSCRSYLCRVQLRKVGFAHQ
jgi:hypothetical protein